MRVFISFFVFLLVSILLVGCNKDDKKEDLIDKVANKITFTIIKKDNTSSNAITGDLNLITSLDEVEIKWTSNKPDVISTSGVVTRPSVDTDVELTSTLSHKDFKDKVVKITVKVLKVGADPDPDPDVIEKKLKEILNVEFSVAPAYDITVVSYVGVQKLLHVIDQELVNVLNSLNVKYKPISAEEIPEEDERSLHYLAFQLQVTKDESEPEATRDLVVAFGSDDGINWHMAISNIVTNEHEFFEVVNPGSTIKNLVYMWKGNITQKDLFDRTFENKTNQTAQIFVGVDPLEELILTFNNQEIINAEAFETKIIPLEKAKSLLEDDTLSATTVQTLLKEISGEEVMYSKKIAVYGFSNGEKIVMIHDYSKTKTDVDADNYILCLEITEIFDIESFIEQLKSASTLEEITNQQIVDKYILVEYHLGESIKTDDSDKDTELKLFLELLEFEVVKITNEEYTENTKYEDEVSSYYYKLSFIIDVTTTMKVHIDIVSIDNGESWYLRTYEKDNIIRNQQFFLILSGANDVKIKIDSHYSL